MHSATAKPSRSAGPRPRRGSTNATSAGVRVKKWCSSSLPISGKPRSRPNSSSENACVAKNDLPTSPQIPSPEAYPSYIRRILGEYCGDPHIETCSKTHVSEAMMNLTTIGASS